MVNKVALEQFFSAYFGVPLSVSVHYCCILVHSRVITLYYVGSRQRRLIKIDDDNDDSDIWNFRYTCSFTFKNYHKI